MSVLTQKTVEAEIRLSPAPAIRTAREQAARPAADPHRFAECMETALTGIVFTGVLLFAAGLLRCAVPACTPREIADIALLSFAAVTFGATALQIGRGIFGR